jgi:ER membrane protein complex subunit 7
MMIHSVLLFISSLLALTQALDITGSIAASNQLPSPALLPPSTLLVLSAPNLEYKTHASATGSFTFRNVTAGPSYLLQVQCLTHAFSPLRIDTTREGNEVPEVYQTFRGNQWGHRGIRVTHPIELVPSAKADYYLVSPCLYAYIAANGVQD